MKYPAHVYAKALIEVLDDVSAEKKTAGARDEEKLAKNFLELVKRNGDEMHLRKILEEASRFARGRNGFRKVIIDSARAFTPAQRKEVAHVLKKDDVITERIDPSLIAGMRITVNDELQFDGSLKRKLDTAFGA